MGETAEENPMEGYFSLKTEAPFCIDKGLDRVTIGLGWDAKKEETNDEDADLDAWAILKSGGAYRDVVYYGHLASKCKSIQLSKDNRTGVGKGDDEQLWFELNKLPATITHVEIWITIYDAVARGQHFGQIQGAHCRLFKGIKIPKPKEEAKLARFEMPRGRDNIKTMHVATLVREETERKRWVLKRVEESYEFDYEEMCKRNRILFARA